MRNKSRKLLFLSDCSLRGGCHRCFVTRFLRQLGKSVPPFPLLTLIYKLAFVQLPILPTSSFAYWARCLLEISKKKTLSYSYFPDTPGTEHKLCTQPWTRYLILPDYYSSKYFKVALNSLSPSPAISVSCKAGFLHIGTAGIWAQVTLACGVLSPTLRDFEQHAWLLFTRCR